jgi:hypothetical protein
MFRFVSGGNPHFDILLPLYTIKTCLRRKSNASAACCVCERCVAAADGVLCIFARVLLPCGACRENKKRPEGPCQRACIYVFRVGYLSIITGHCVVDTSITGHCVVGYHLSLRASCLSLFFPVRFMHSRVVPL